MSIEQSLDQGHDNLQSAVENQFSLALEMTRLGAWTWSIAGDRVHCDLTRSGGGTFSGTFSEFLQRVDPDDRLAVEGHLKHCLASRSDYAQCYGFQSAGCSSAQTIEVRARPHYDEQGRTVALLGLARSGKDGKVENDSSSHFRALFQAAKDAVLIADDNRRYVDANPAAGKLLGLSPENIIGRSIDEFVVDVGNSEVVPAWQDFQTVGIQRGECRLLRADGTFCDAEYSATSNFAPGLHLSILRDISERKRSDEALSRQAAELIRSNADLQEFAYATSHDLQEPLRTISSFSQMLARRYKGRLDADADEYLDYIVTGAQRLKRMIDSLLTYSSVVNQDTSPITPVLLSDPLHWATENLQAGIVETDATVMHGELPTVNADKVLMTALFQNLIGNSIKYRSNERTPRIEVSAERHDDMHLIKVRDNGVGIPPEQSERIFGVFKRLHGHEIPGAGIGLAICKRIVEKHGGTIWVDSDPSQGSTFSFTLPMQRPD